jgi:pyridoxine/pyridoxamine 5'-phosphate oxidase
MNRSELYAYLRQQRLAVQASTAPSGTPQAAVVGYAVSERLEIIFDTVGTTRKMTNLRKNPAIALVIGWQDEQTVQIEGIADEPQGEDLARLKRIYFEAFPDGVARQSWPDITYVRVRPRWVRHSDYRNGSTITELSANELDEVHTH